MAGGGAVRTGRRFLVRTDRYKHMFFPGAQHTEMLFDLKTDPGEMKNLADEKTLVGQLDRHRQLLDRFVSRPATFNTPDARESRRPA